MKVQLLLFTSLLSCIAARRPVYQRYASGVFGSITYISDTDSSAFGYYGQLAADTQIPLFKANEKKRMTVIMPDNNAFQTFIEGGGGNVSDPESVSGKAWQERWNEEFEYFWFEGTLNTSEINEGETIVLSSKKQSSAGDWPLHIAFTREYASDGIYNGTISSYPWGEGNITFPDFDTSPYLVVAQVVNYWPTQPRYLGETMVELGYPDWSSVVARSAVLSSLDNTYNYTLFLPPSSTIARLPYLSSTLLEAFISAHLVLGERVVLQPNAVTVQNNFSASTTSVRYGGVEANVVRANVLTNGGIVQMIDQSLIDLNSTTTPVLSSRGRDVWE